MTKVALVNPVDRTEISGRLGLRAPPLNLMYLAAALEEAGFPVRIVDANLQEESPGEIARQIRAMAADIVGLTAATATIKTALQYVREIKRAIPDTFTIIGGPHASFLPIETLQMERRLDAVVIGEGEQTIVDLANACDARNGSTTNIKGIAYRIREGKDEKIIVNDPRPLIEDLDSVPFPARHLVPFNEYGIFNKGTTIGVMITSRGCPYACEYCASSHLMGRMIRFRSPKNVVDEVEELKNRYRADTIEFIDDNFMINRKRALEIGSELKARGLDVSLLASSRVNTVDRELLKSLRSAGLSTVYLGVESGSQRILDLMNKRITLAHAEKAVSDAREAGIKTLASFILGYPGETVDDMRATIRFATKLDPDYAQFSVLTPYPGTPIFHRLREKGLLATEDWDKYTALDPVVRYEDIGLSSRSVSWMLKEAYLRFYLRPLYLLRRKGMIKALLFSFLNTYVVPHRRNNISYGWFKSPAGRRRPLSRIPSQGEIL
ncbi:MAG: B12-binding domain-containing radical SAM protein [Thermoplasmata archaeon]